MSVSLNEVVRLQCPAASLLSQQLWERPNSRLTPDLYLLLGDGSLSFVATPATLGPYLCLSTENGYQQTVAIYHVKQGSGPVAQTPSSHSWPQNPPIPTTEAGARLRPSAGPEGTETEPTRTSRDAPRGGNVSLWAEGPKETELWDRGPLQAARGPCYLKELVVVSVLLVLSLSLLITTLLYVFRQRCRSRTAPQTGPPSRDSDRRTPVEQEGLQGGQVLSKRNGQGGGFACNGALTGSNGHLPNTPI